MSYLALSIQIGRKSSPYNSEDKEVSHTNLGRAQNAVLLNGLGHDDDSPNDASYDTSNHNFQTLMLAGRDGEWGSKVADRTDNHAPLMAVSQTNEPFHGLRRPTGQTKAKGPQR
jgi:hypothetical protein